MGAWFRALAWAAAIAGAALLALYTLAFDVWKVPSDDPLLTASIQPTLHPGDLLVVTRRTTVARGDLLRCGDPQAPGRFVIGRALARTGERITIEGDVVNIDGRRLPSPRACDEPSLTVFDPRTSESVRLSCGVEDYGEMTFGALRLPGRPDPPAVATVEAGRWFLVSDDRHVHLDSRDYGQIDPASCQHIVFRIMGPEGFSDPGSRLNVIW